MPEKHAGNSEIPQEKRNYSLEYHRFPQWISHGFPTATELMSISGLLHPTRGSAWPSPQERQQAMDLGQTDGI